jgi:hypothetical protein
VEAGIGCTLISDGDTRISYRILTGKPLGKQMWQNVNNETNLKETAGGKANWLRIMSTYV